MVLPAPIRRVIQASADNDMNAFLDAFADDVLFSDSHRKFWGKESLRRWASIEWIGDFVQFVDVRDIIVIREDYVVNAVIKGIYDTEGLPSDYVVTFHFKIREDRIVRLIILNSNGRRLGKMTQTRMASTCFSEPVPFLNPRS